MSPTDPIDPLHARLVTDDKELLTKLLRLRSLAEKTEELGLELDRTRQCVLCP